MISVASGSSASAVGDYFKQPDYYSKDGKGSEGIWLGKGAKELDLYQKVVTETDFQKYLDGNFPGRTTMGKIVDGQRKRNPGWDNTVSSPAGASVAIEVFDDRELSKNHTKSASTTAKFIEAESLTVKVWNKETAIQDLHKEQKGLIAAFRHRTSRNLDPNTHTHLFFINAGLDKDGKWRSLDSKSSFYDTKMLHGIIARSEEAYGAKNLGREIYTYSKDGKYYWDLKNIDTRLAEAFSTRSQEIKEFLGPGDHSAAAKSNAAQVTRKNKQTANLKSLKKEWRRRVQSLGYNFEKEQKKAFSQSDTLPRRSSRVIYNHAINHLSEGNSSFSRNELLHAILSRGLGDIRYPDAKREISRAVREKRLLVRKDADHASNRVFTTPQLKETEVELIRTELAGRGTRTPIYSRSELSDLLEKTSLNPSQQLSLQQVTLSTSSIIGIQGLAGVGKSYTAKHIVEAAEKKGLTPIILAPSSSVKSDLSKDMQRQTRTLQSYLARPEGTKNSIVILDEASMVGTRDMLKFLKIAEEKKFNRVILMGDARQLSSTQAGSPFTLLQKAGMRTTIIDKVIRQEDEKYQEMVRHAYEGNVDKVLSILDKNLNEVGYDKIDQEAVKSWLNSKDRDSIAIVANTNARIDRINKQVKTALKDSGQIKKGIEHQVYKAMNISSADKSSIGNYIHADAVRFYKSYKPLGIQANQIYKITRAESDSGKVSLRGPNGKIVVFSPEKSADKIGSFSLLKESQIELSAGDKIMFTSNSYKHKLDNKDVFQVVGINGSKIELTHFDNGAKKEIGLHDPALKFIRHSWAGTNHSTQGKSVKGVIVAMAAHERMTDQSSFYVAISRFKQAVKMYTDDKEQLRHILNIRDAKPVHALTKSEMLQIAADVKLKENERELERHKEHQHQAEKMRAQQPQLSR